MGGGSLFYLENFGTQDCLAVVRLALANSLSLGVPGRVKAVMEERMGTEKIA